MIMAGNRKLNHASPHYLDCCSFDDIYDYYHGGLSPERRAAVFEHLNLEKCSRCQGLYLDVEIMAADVERLKKRKADEAGAGGAGTAATKIKPEPPAAKIMATAERLEWLKKRMKKPVRPATPEKLALGQVWTTGIEVRGNDGRILGKTRYAFPVLIVGPGSGEISSANLLRAAPLSIDTDFAHPGHSVLLSAGPFAYPVIAEAFNETPMLAANLKEFKGTVQEEDMNAYQNAREMFLAGKAPAADPELVKWEEKELRLTEYLAWPVNEALWSADDDLEEVFGEDPESFQAEEPLVYEEKASSGVTPSRPAGAAVAEIHRPDFGGELHSSPVIELEEYALAAATADINLDDLRLYILAHEPENLTIAIAQMRDQVVLRVVVQDKEIEPVVKVAREAKILKRLLEGVYETVLGSVDYLRGELAIDCLIAGQEFHFLPVFQPPVR